MELSSVVVMTVKKGERNFELLMPMGAPYGEAYDAVFEMLGKIVELSKEAAEKAKRPETTTPEVVEKVN